jgi:hypothetical protein
LAHFLKPGGALVVVDITRDGYRNPFHMLPADAHYVAHKHGFDESDLHKAFESAGLSFLFDSETLKGEGEHAGGGHQHDADLFIAKGIKQ